VSRSLLELRTERRADETTALAAELAMQAIAEGDREVAARWLRLDLRALALVLAADGLMPDAVRRITAATVHAREIVRQA
jgi:uncharacterized protein with PhoU and TrkA domain